MNIVAPGAARATARSAATAGAGTANGGDRPGGGPHRRPGPVGGSVQHRRARPAGRASSASCPSSTSPGSHSRCQTAKSAYCTGSGGSGSGLPAPERRVERRQLARKHRGRPARRTTMWCSASTSTCSSAPTAGSGSPGSAAPPPGRTAARRPASTSSAPPRHAGPGRPDTSATGSGNGPGGSITWRGRSRPAPATSRVRSTSCRATHRAQRRAQRVHVQRCRRSRAPRHRHVVLSAPGLELVQEPQPLLRERQRQHPVPAHRGHRRGGQAPATPRRPPPPARPPSGRRTAPPAAPRPRAPPGPATPPGWPAASGRPGRRSCRAAPDPVHAQHLAPRSRPAAPPVDRARRRRTRRRRGRAPSGAGSAARSTFPFGVSGSAASSDEHRRDHVLRQPRRPGTRAAPRPAGCPGRAGDHVGHQPRARPVPVAPPPPPRRTAGCAASAASTSPGSIRNPRTLTCSSARPQELQLPVRPPPRPVPGPVQPRPVPGERVRDEPLRRQRRAAQVPARHLRPGDEQLPGHPRRHQPQLPVQHVHPGTGQRPADRHRPVRPRHRAAAR